MSTIYGGVREEMFWLEGRRRLWGMLHLPAGAGRSGGAARPVLEPGFSAVFCSPFAEEEKCSRRLYVQLARALARRGVPSLRFSYAGTGDSEGEFYEFRLESAIQDTQRAFSYCRETLGSTRLAVVGLRLGASIALQAAAAEPAVVAAALWAPIVDGRSYVRMNFRRKAIRQMVTTADAAGTGGPAAAAGPREAGPTGVPNRANTQDGMFDFDGYAVAKELWGDMEALRLEPPADWRSRALIVSIAAAERTDRDSANLAGALEDGGVSASLRHLTVQPFWNLLGLVECPAIVDLTADWLVGEAAQPAPGAV